MARIAHLKMTCPECGKYTSIYVTEDGAASAKVKCQHCNQVFDFRAGCMYEPVGYVPAIPEWAVIRRTENAANDISTPASRPNECPAAKNRKRTFASVCKIIFGIALLVLGAAGSIASIVRSGETEPEPLIAMGILIVFGILLLIPFKKKAK